MKKAFSAGGLVALLALVACSQDTGDSAISASPSDRAASGPSSNAAGGAVPTTTGGGATTSPAPSSSGSSTSSNAQSSQTPGATNGSLTAGVWDDNLNFDFFKKYVALTGDLNAMAVPAFTDAERASAEAQWSGARSAKTELDLAFMIDTTGSMGDELSYVQTSIQGIVTQITTKHPNLAPHIGLVVYRDFVDPYQTRTFDFGDVASFQANIDAQGAGGGGDYPEDVADGMAATLKLGWRADANVARMAIWIADAPPHEDQAAAVHDSIAQAAQKDVHFYPVAASGADNRTEFTMRTAAQMTGGRYVFLTNDSGIGDDHEEPHIPCYVVTPFNDAVERMVESELTGQHIDAPASDILRTVGNPVGGVCPTQENIQVSIY